MSNKFRVVQFIQPWSGHVVGDRRPMRDWLADALAAQGIVKFVIIEMDNSELLSAAYNPA